jgi:DNA-binding CsgD family transcriptional regulator
MLVRSIGDIGSPCKRSVVNRHHERHDGSGYPAGVRASELDTTACLLATADVPHALSEPRPHRAALDLATASRVLSDLPLDRDAIRAVLDAADAPPPVLPPLPANLTEREVLQLLAVGRTKREIASGLVISPSTVHTHTVHIYDTAVVRSGFEAVANGDLASQILLFALDGDRVRSVDQFVGDPAAVTAFWA